MDRLPGETLTQKKERLAKSVVDSPEVLDYRYSHSDEHAKGFTASSKPLAKDTRIVPPTVRSKDPKVLQYQADAMLQHDMRPFGNERFGDTLTALQNAPADVKRQEDLYKPFPWGKKKNTPIKESKSLRNLQYILLEADIENIEKKSVDNDYFRHVLYTSKNMQLVVMALKPGEDIGEEVHKDTDQFFRVEEGNGKAIIEGKTYSIKNGTSVLVPKGTKHNIKNSSDKPLKLYTIYSPPKHKDGHIDKTKPIENK